MTGSIVPKTLFGEKYVSLVDPGRPGLRPHRGRRDHRAHRGRHRGRAGALRPLPAAADRAARAAQPDPQRPGDRARRPRRPARRQHRDARQLPEADQPADPEAGRGPAARPRRCPTTTPTCCRRSPRSSTTPSLTTGTLEGREEKLHDALRRRVRLLRHRHRLPRRERRQPDPAQRGRPGAVPGLREVRARVLLPDPRHRQRRQAPGRGVPRVHPPHRARDAAPPAARLRRRRHPALRRDPGPELPAPAEPAVEPVQPGAPPAELRRRRRRADRQGHQPGRAQRQLPHQRSRQRRGDRAAPLAARPRPSASSAADVPDLGVLLVGPMARGAEVSLR